MYRVLALQGACVLEMEDRADYPFRVMESAVHARVEREPQLYYLTHNVLLVISHGPAAEVGAMPTMQEAVGVETVDAGVVVATSSSAAAHPVCGAYPDFGGAMTPSTASSSVEVVEADIKIIPWQPMEQPEGASSFFGLQRSLATRLIFWHVEQMLSVMQVMTGQVVVAQVEAS
jgi:hypothetical protein